MVNKELIDEIKRNNSIVDTARRLGLELHRVGREYRSCGGDVIDLVAEVKFNGNKGETINELSGGKAYIQNDEYKKYVQDLQTYINKWHEALRPEDIDYLTGRGLTLECINKMLLGYNAKEQRLIIPYFERGQVIYYCGRDMSGQNTKTNIKKLL